MSLREVTKDTVSAVLELKVRPDQECFVAPNSVSIAQAYFYPEAWFRAIYAGETPVGFVMLELRPDKPLYYLWRFMVDARYQRAGFGRDALRLVIEHVRTLPGATELTLSFVDRDGSPEEFYRELGFERTGEEDHGEQIMRLTL